MWRLLALTIAVIVGGQPRAGATSFIERPFPDTVQEAPVIVRGTVGASTTDWGKEGDGGRRIFTYWDLRITEVLKGAAGQKGELIKIREMGGEKDGMGMQVAGTASFVAAEEVVVFLSEKNAENSHDVWGMMMGKLNVNTDQDGHEFLTGAAITGEHGDYPHASAWTIGSLRKLIAAQAGPAQAAPPEPQSTPEPTRTVIPPVTPSPAPDASGAALQLQSSPSVEHGLPSGLWLLMGAAVLGIAGFFIARKR
jgi:hypothetical protein